MNLRYLHILLALLLLPHVMFAAVEASCDVDFMRRCDGREFEVRHVIGNLVSDSDALVTDSANVWDFSGAVYSGLNMPLSFSKNDSVIYATTDRLRLTFITDSTSLLLQSKESPFIKVDYSPTVAMRPLSVGNAECRSEYTADGRIFQSNFIYARGISESYKHVSGTLIRSEGDTIPDVCLDLRSVCEKIYISNAPCDSSYLAALPDSAFSVETNHIFTWRKLCDMTPLAQSIFISSGATVGSPEYEIWSSFILFDLEEEVPAIQSMRKPNTANNDGDSANAEYDGNNLTVRGVYGENVSVMVTDILGRIYCKVDGPDASSGLVTVPIKLNNGAYVVAVFNGNDVTSIKFVVE